MKIAVTEEQATNLVKLHQQMQLATVRLNEAVQALAPGIEAAQLVEDEGAWFLTDEPDEDDAPAV